MPLSLSRRISIIVSEVIAPISDTKQSFTHSAIYTASWCIFCNWLLLPLVGNANLTFSVWKKKKKPNHTLLCNTSKYCCFPPSIYFKEQVIMSYNICDFKKDEGWRERGWVMLLRKMWCIWLANGHPHSNFSGENQQLGLEAELCKYCAGVEKTNSHIGHCDLYTGNALKCKK